MARKTEKCDVYDQWTKSRFFSFIRSALRRSYSRWPPKFEVMKEARREYKGPGRQKYEYQCAECKKWFPQKQVQVDHIVPAGSLRDWDDLVEFTQKLLCGKDGLQVLCKECHAKKTALERKQKKEGK